MMTNQQAALIAAAFQIGGNYIASTATKQRTVELAREYVTWLDQVDQVSATISLTKPPADERPDA